MLMALLLLFSEILNTIDFFPFLGFSLVGYELAIGCRCGFDLWYFVVLLAMKATMRVKNLGICTWLGVVAWR